MPGCRLLPPPPQTQARSSSTFKPPPLDGSLSLVEIYDWHLKNNPQHRLFKFAQDDGSIRTIFWPEAVMAVYVGAKLVRDRIRNTFPEGETPVVAVLAPSDAIPYFTIMMSIMRANCIALPISPRNSPVAVAHLISKTEVRHILVGREPAMVELVDAALEIIRDQYPFIEPPKTSPMPLFEELYLSQAETAVTAQDVPYILKGPDATAMILHSSGSTAFPKPIYWSNHRFSQLTLIPWFGERDLTDKVFSLHVMPFYHGMGVLQLLWTASCGLVVSAFEPKSPAPVPTADALFEAAKATDSNIIFCVPSFIEAWSRNPEYVKWLTTRDGVLFGGGPLNKEAGDYMTSQGVSIFILYGSTEGGIMSPILPAEVGYDWEYFRFPGLVKSKMVPYGNNTFELVMVSNTFCEPSVLNTQVDGIDAYATSDLMVPHPTKPGYWKIHGRTDDQIMHNTGEKTNPGPLENMLNQDPHVLSSVMFGRCRFQAGVLIDLKPAFRFDPVDQAKLADYRNKIWPTIERMNAYAPQHSRLFKEMIMVAKPSKPFTYTAKNTARRQAVINDYTEEIDALYDMVEESTQSSIPPPSHWDIVSAADFVRAVAVKVLGHTVRDDDDFFQHGCDSLQATWIRNSLLRALRDSAYLDTRKTSRNFVYDYPSIQRLASFVFSVASDSVDDAADSSSGRPEAMQGMVAKYTGQYPTRPEGPLRPLPLEDTVLVTGTTGSLGCYLLARLVEDMDVIRVYAFNRAAGDKATSIVDRQRSALQHRGLDPRIADSGKVVLLEGDLNKDNWDLPPNVYTEMNRSVTHIIHNAWRVDFNLALASFESNVKGVRSLIDFSLKSCLLDSPRLIFTSSIGVFQNPEGVQPQLEQPIPAQVAIGTGYTESKWVSEQIIRHAADETSLKAVIVRVGQLCGASGGAWSLHEWFPSMVQSALTLRCFPSDHRSISWIPLELAASALIALRGSSVHSSVIHLIHPRPVPWSIVADVISLELSVSLVPYADWLQELERSIESTKNGQQANIVDTFADIALLRKVRALRLLLFYRSLAKATGGDALGFSTLSMSQALSCLPTLSATNIQLTPGDVRMWLSQWREEGLFSDVR